MVAPPLLWLGLAALLLLLVLIGADLDGLLLLGALAALLLSLASGLLPLAGPLQVVIYALLVFAGGGWLRRASQKRAERTIHPAPSAELAEVIEAFDSRGEGRVRWQGQSWAAQNMEPQHRLAPGSRVTVLGREGTRLQVLAQR